MPGESNAALSPSELAKQREILVRNNEQLRKMIFTPPRRRPGDGCLRHIPGLNEACSLLGMDPIPIRAREHPALIPVYDQILKEIKTRPESGPFRKAVNKKAVPHYYDVVKYPMDLETMEERLKKRYYIGQRLFVADMNRIISNSKLFYAPHTKSYQCGILMEKFFKKKCEEHQLSLNPTN